MYCAVGVKMASGAISVCIEFWRRSNMKIAIMTFYKEDNYGTVLQAAALRRYLCELGHEADLIRYVSDGKVQTIYKDSVKNEFRKQVREELREERNPVVTGKISGEGFARFREANLTETFECVTLSDLERLNEIYDAFICGSERIWYATSFDSHLFLDFVHDPQRMIAYAPSVLREGMQDLHVRKRMGELISRFSYLSVREEIGRKLMDEYFAIQTEEVADPVLLLNTREWEEMFIRQNEKMKEDAGIETAQESVPEEAAEEEIAEETEAAAEEAAAEETAEEETAAEETAAEETAEEEIAEEEIAEEKIAEEEIAEEEITEEKIAEEAAEEETAGEETSEEETSQKDRQEAFDFEDAQFREKPYMFVYYLSGRNAYWDAAYKLAQRLGLDVKAVPVYENDLNRPAVLTEEVDPADFVRLIQNASYVCTDCYHAALMGILFHREMCCFNRYPDGDMSGRNIRIRQILDAVGMLDRLYDDNTPLEQYLEKTDFIPVQYKLDALQLKSHAFLKAALRRIDSKEVLRKEQNFHVREAYRLCCGCGACQAVCPVGAAVVSMQKNGFYEAAVDEEKCVRCGRCTQVCPMREESRGLLLKEGQLLSYTDEQEDVCADSDAGGLARRLTGLCLDQGYIIAGCAFDENLRGARHILIRPEEDAAEDASAGTEKAEQVIRAEAAVQTPEELPERDEEFSETGENLPEEETAGTEENLPEEEVPETEEELPEEETAETAKEQQEDVFETAEELSEKEETGENGEIIEEAEEIPGEDIVKETKMSREDLLRSLQGIKLSQSDFSAVWKLLEEEDHPALIIGAPCQIAAARKVFEGRTDIVYMDFVCGGVPTKLLTEKYRHTFRGRSGISQERFRIRFRYKNQEKGNQFILITDDTREKIIPMKKDALCRMLDMGGCCSEACFNCRWRDRTCADIRIGTADGSGTGEKQPGVVHVRARRNEVPTLSAGCFGNKKENVTALFCMTPRGKEMLDLLMTSGYWEGLHRQQKEVYLQNLRTVNNPVPVYYPELMEMLSDENIHLKKILNEYAKPAEKREKILRRMQRFTRAGRKRAKQIRRKRMGY